MALIRTSRPDQARPTHIRYLVLATLFLVSTFSYGDRVALSITGISFAKDLHLSSLQLGYLFSGFSWAYVVAQLPSGWMLDRFGTKRVYGTETSFTQIVKLNMGIAFNSK